jgi:hypothetical protein
MVSLERVFIKRMTAPDLTPLLQLPRLTMLSLELHGEADFSIVSELGHLTEVYLAAHASAGVESILQIDFLRLRHAEVIELAALTERPGRMSTAWIPRHPSLRWLGLDGIAPANGRLDDLMAAKQLEFVRFTPASPSDLTRLEAALPDAHVKETLDAPSASEIVAAPVADGVSYTLRVDLVDLWGEESNYEGEFHLREELERHAPSLARTLSFDTESDSVGVITDSRADLETVLELVERRPGTRD